MQLSFRNQQSSAGEIALYFFSFMGYDWPRSHASQPEILAYVKAPIDRYELQPHLRYNAAIDAVVAALGLLNVPRYPEWPGLEQYALSNLQWRFRSHFT
jgi:cation diffusion facilitator CzcD-associated flavoprotein CzcO